MASHEQAFGQANDAKPCPNYSLLFPLGLGSVLGLAFGSAGLVAEVSADLDSEDLLSELLSDFASDLDSEDFESDLLSDLDSDAFFESDAADFL